MREKILKILNEMGIKYTEKEFVICEENTNFFIDKTENPYKLLINRNMNLTAVIKLIEKIKYFVKIDSTFYWDENGKPLFDGDADIEWNKSIKKEIMEQISDDFRMDSILINADQNRLGFKDC